ncbi:MAG: hypothetical protein QNJ72_44630 [Pleurocapsa sp. MO_226.B13]|nr:hypothetical protein [Pleurocapsa sp. MO_226.B13]
MAFIFLWSIGSSLCSIIAATIARKSFGINGTGSTQSIGLLLVIYWILLSLLQWQLLKPYVNNAYDWGWVTILGGIFCCFLLILGFYCAFYFWWRNASIVPLVGKSSSPPEDLWLAFIVTIVSLFGTGFVLGWMQKLVIANSISSKYLNFLPFITGILWFFTVPVFILLYTGYAKYEFSTYIRYTLFTAIFANVIKSLIMQKILFG